MRVYRFVFSYRGAVGWHPGELEVLAHSEEEAKAVLQARFVLGCIVKEVEALADRARILVGP